jgi:type IV pilus assembly protein PilQ
MQGNRYGRAVIAALVAVSLAAPGCVKKPQKDAFGQHWDTKASQSEGYSPSPRPRKVEFSKAAITTKNDAKAEAKPVRELPKQRVTLRMYDTDLVAVVRAMARAANQNVVLSASIPGSTGGGQGQDKGGLRINVNVADAPWDETFKSILSSNGLSYTIDGDIIRVLTIEDLEKQNKIKEANNKLVAASVKTKEFEEAVMAKVEINYADLPKIYATINAMCGSGPTVSTQKDQSNINVNNNQTPRDITPAHDNDDSMQLKYQAGGRRPGQLNCSVVPDQHSNSLIIQAPQADAEKLVALIEDLDKPRPQIKLKAFIVQTDLQTAQALGVQWGGLVKNSYFRLSPAQTAITSTTTTTGNAGSSSATSATTGGTPGSTLTTGSNAANANTGNSNLSNVSNPVFPGGTSGQGFGLNYPALTNTLLTPSGLGAAGTGLNFLFGKIGENVLEAQLTALASDNKVKILANPTITTMENMSAFVENGTDVPYVSTSQNGTNVQFAKATLRLEMLPHVVDGTNLRMKVIVKDDQVDTNNTVQGNPYIYKRETQSNLVVEDGDTIVISGLTRDTVSNDNSGVPFLSNIPGLGWAFKAKSNSVHREQMLVFITPIILKEKPVAPVPPVADRVDPQALSRGPVAAAEVVKP